MEHLTRNHLLNQNQHGFVPKKGCSTNLLETIEYWLNCLEKGNSVDVFYLDFSKAFDRVPHQRLLSKMRSYSFPVQILKWTESFLLGRSQSVKVDTSLSGSKPIRSGVPQGSVMGPLLFVIFVNDLPEVTDNTTTLFADDAKNSGEIEAVEDEETSQKDLDKLEEWSETWQMSFNLGKCKHMRLGELPTSSRYHLRDKDGKMHIIETINDEKDLGVYVDKNLSFKKHIDETVKSSNAILGTIKRTFDTLSPPSFTMLYRSLVRSKLEYCQEVWSPARKGHQDQLEKVQRRATKMVRGLKDEPYETRLKTLGLPSLRHRRLRGDIIFMFKITHGLVHTGMEIPYSTNTTTRGHQYKLETGRYKTLARRQFLTNRVVNEWNSLPRDVVSARTINCFKTRLDCHWALTKNQFEF